VDDQPLIPDYRGANLCGVVPGLMRPPSVAPPAWFPTPLWQASQVVLLVIDGFGWNQFQERRHLCPAIASMEGGAVTTVVPSTTATALTSIVTGLTPGEHGIVGYRMDVGGEVLNTLRWSTGQGDVRRQHVPAELQPHPPFLGASVPVISRTELETSAFSEAHLRGARFSGWRAASSIAVEVRRQLEAGEPFVYAYYDGVDKIAHERGFGPFYDAEVVTADRLVADVLDALVPGSALVVTADHGQVEVGENTITPAPDVLELVRMQSGEGRFRWLHARPGAAHDLEIAAREAHGDVAWVVSVQQMIDEQWFGPVLPPPVARRLGDVALVARAAVSFDDPADSGPFQLVCRHGSLTADEMLVPFVARAHD
jgi:predicted AlkP superfamily pyrophosphatase or phosphodiesterase